MNTLSFIPRFLSESSFFRGFRISDTARILYFLVLPILLTTSCVTEDTPDEGVSYIAPGDSLPDFSAVMDDGSTFSPRCALGKSWMLLFFSTGCADCRRELPQFQKLHEKRPDIPIVCIARDEDAVSIESFWRDNDLSLPYSPQPDRKIFSMFASAGIPRLYIIGPDGTVRYTFSPQEITDNVLSIAALL